MNPEPTPLVEAQIMELRRMAVAYQEDVFNRFEVGQLVTPDSSLGMFRGAGDPHIVLQLGEQYGNPNEENAGSFDFGQRLDMRVGKYAGGRYVAYWVESWAFVPYAEDPSSD